MKKLGLLALLLIGSVTVFAQGTLVNDSLYSPALGRWRLVDIYLPPDYDNSGLNYPVIYFLHGMGENQGSYSPMISLLDGLIGGGLMSPLMVVKPDGSTPPFAGSMWTNSEIYGRFEDYVAEDVISYIDSHYRTLAARNSRALLGHSMGGYGGMTMAFKHPDLFCAVVSLSGFLAIDPFDFWRQQVLDNNGGHGPYDPNSGWFTLATYTAGAAFSPNLQLPPYYVDFPLDSAGNVVDSVYQRWQRHMPAEIARTDSSVRSLTIFFDCGTQDELGFYPQNVHFAQALDSLGVPHRFESYVGDHTNLLYLRGALALVLLDSVMQAAGAVPEIPTGIPAQLSLAQNYPNPFNGSTTIEFTLPHGGLTSLRVYDLLGREAAQLVEGNLPAGVHRAVLAAEALPSGVYFCRLQYGRQAITQKMMLLR
jgi:S-formylglutathione hydrolase FrmB